MGIASTAHSSAALCSAVQCSAVQCQQLTQLFVLDVMHRIGKCMVAIMWHLQREMRILLLDYVLCSIYWDRASFAANMSRCNGCCTMVPLTRTLHYFDLHKMKKPR